MRYMSQGSLSFRLPLVKLPLGGDCLLCFGSAAHARAHETRDTSSSAVHAGHCGIAPGRAWHMGRSMVAGVPHSTRFPVSGVKGSLSNCWRLALHPGPVFGCGLGERPACRHRHEWRHAADRGCWCQRLTDSDRGVFYSCSGHREGAYNPCPQRARIYRLMTESGSKAFPASRPSPTGCYRPRALRPFLTRVSSLQGVVTTDPYSSCCAAYLPALAYLDVRRHAGKLLLLEWSALKALHANVASE